jgi:hypothetical protein
VGNDNTVRFEGLVLQIPEQQVRYSYSRTHVLVHRYVDATLSVWHGPRLLARYSEQGELVQCVTEQTDQRLAA